jgi:citrate lyase subunit beta/citryl-CoA lyase
VSQPQPIDRAPIRSMLFIPGDSDKKLGKIDACGADAVILDLEDSVAPPNKARARALVAAFIGERPKAARTVQLWVRINPLDTDLALGDLAAVIAAAPDGIMQPKANGAADVERLSHYLDAFETLAGLPLGSTAIVPLVTETARAPFALGEYATVALPRLAGLSWGAEDLSAALGASTNQAPGGGFAFTYQMVRAQTLLAAHAAGVPAIDTLHADFRDDAGLLASSREARAEGWSGRLAIHPAQVAPINAGFSPSAEDVALARRVVAAFEADPGLGTIGIDGRMFDIPHLIAARRTLAIAAAAPVG